MPLQNRVDPWGKLVATSARGTLLGNRGILHNSQKQIIKPYQHQNWVTCKLKFKGRKRVLMSPRKYTELFFLDEATAFAAGHRPCCECRRERYLEFKNDWIRANLDQKQEAVKASDISRIMHKERIKKKVKITFRAKLKELPEGTLFSNSGSAYIVFETRACLWSFEGYCAAAGMTLPEEVDVLTPRSIVNAFKLVFKPEIHESVLSIR